jgi:hypothetical protein
MGGFAIAWAMSLASQGTFPDQSDVLRAVDTTPQIELVLDTSCSMASGWETSVCTAFPTSAYTCDASKLSSINSLRSKCSLGQNCSGSSGTKPCCFYRDIEEKKWCSYQSGGQIYLNKADQVKSSLTGCKSPTDGLLDKWANKLQFAIREFGGSRVGLLREFNSSLAQLESTVLALTADGGTPLAPAYRNAGQHMGQYFDNTNSKSCRQNYVLLMTDGISNGGGASFNYECTGAAAVSVGNNPQNGSRYLLEYVKSKVWRTSDILCKLNGIQPIRTYTIGFGEGNEVDEVTLRGMADLGDGQYFPATNYTQLDAAFSEILSNIVSRAAVSFGGSTIENDGFFSGNYLYASAFKPYETGNWAGTARKYCIFPDLLPTGKYDTSQQACVFLSRDGKDLLTNPVAKDLYSGSTNQDATEGGTGRVLLDTVIGADIGATPPSNPLDKRKLFTWTQPNPSNYVAVLPTTLSSQNTWSAGECGHRRLLNKLHGYTYGAVDCAAGNYDPVAVTWPLGASIGSPTLLVKYTKSCENVGDKCYIVTGSDDGQIHFFDARTGIETSAVVPGEILNRGYFETGGTTSMISTHLLTDLWDQPAPDATHRHYVDGDMRLVHVDKNGNGYIDNGETANLLVGLGRGGYQYMLFPLSKFNGVPAAADNLPRIMNPSGEGTTKSFYHLREAWAAPWTGRVNLGGQPRTVAAFGSGHIGYLDEANGTFAQLPPGLPDKPRTRTVACGTLFTQNGANPQFCAPPFPATCLPGTCYDGVWTPPAWWTSAAPHSYGHGPLTSVSGSKVGIAYRVRFSFVDLQPGDTIEVRDAKQRLVQLLTSANNSAAVVTSDWVFSSSVYVQFKSNGVDTVAAKGYAIQDFDVLESEAPGKRPTASPGLTRPGVYVVDVDEWAKSGHKPALRLRVTSKCDSKEVNETCIDATAPDSADLAHMVCPISSEISGLAEGGLLRALYFGDECGQIWKTEVKNNGTWFAKRLLKLNGTTPGATLAGKKSKDYRKIFGRLDIVLSDCSGRRSVGVYFGTGNVQRPASTDDLEDTSLTNGRNVLGVVWDNPLLPSNLTLANLKNVTSELEIVDTKSGSAVNGFYLELRDDEKVLRDPLVFSGTAFFKTYSPATSGTTLECTASTGVDRVYAFDSCTTKPIADGPDAGTVAGNSVSDREVWSGSVDIGQGFVLFTPKEGESFVSLANMRKEESASLGGKKINTNVQLFLWRTMD